MLYAKPIVTFIEELIFERDSVLEALQSLLARSDRQAIERFRTAMVFLSTSVWPALRRMKSPSSMPCSRWCTKDGWSRRRRLNIERLAAWLHTKRRIVVR